MRQLALLSLCLTACSQIGSAPPANQNDLECQIQSDAQHTPGYPYDLVVFRTQVLPMLNTSCATAGCHAAPAGQGNFTLWADAAPGNCSYAKTFNSFKKAVDLTTPENSKVYLNIVGDNPKHPLVLGKENPASKMLLAFIAEAARVQTGAGGGGGGNTPPPNASPFDYAVFQATIQPILDNTDGKGCSAAACHGAAAGQAGFKLNRAPIAASAEMEANFNMVNGLADLTAPEKSKIYLRATTRHGAGASALMSPPEAKALLDYITQAGKNAAPGSGGGAVACPSPNNFDSSVFRDEILPILTGQVDLNNRNDPRNVAGCAKAACHGADRTGGALVIKTTNSVQQNLANFACFVNLTSPSSSEILQCPLDQPGCRHSPHPGQVVFANAQDRNYQRILSYLYGAKTVASPLDFAFFARRVNPLFGDVTAVAAGSNRTCADAGCHGTSIAGQAASNGSNFPILSNASDKGRLLVNFASALNFTNFLEPRGSSLFLYPTNEIANLANPFATGLPHPGGLDFSPDSTQARDMLRWSGGLRPDGEGRQTNWLVAGDYPITLINDITAIDEVRVKPAIFDKSGAPQFNNGEWDGLFSDNGNVDLAAAFPRALQNGRAAYAVAYIINTTSFDIQADLTLVSPNAVKLYVGAQPILQANDARAGVTGLATLPAFGTSRTATRILVKVFQRAQDQRFEFQMFLRDQFGNPLTDVTRELVIKLSPDGGI
jgi:hypothetical protein